jgi:hypothetical protein
MNQRAKNKSRLTPLRILTLLFAAAVPVSVAVSAQGPSDLNQQLADARAATAIYHDMEVALEDGFELLPPGSCHGGSDGAVGISYVNRPRFVDPLINTLEPEFLNYIPTGDGNLRLVSVAYGTRVNFRDTRSPDTPGYRPGTFAWTSPIIPPYLEIVNAPFTVFGQQANGPFFEGRWIYLITAHLWAPNPNGMFADLNPLLRCPE